MRNACLGHGGGEFAHENGEVFWFSVFAAVWFENNRKIHTNTRKRENPKASRYQRTKVQAGKATVKIDFLRFLF